MNRESSEMSIVAATIQSTIRAALTSGLSNEAACLSALIGVLSYIRVDGLPEDILWEHAQQATPLKHQREFITALQLD